MASSHYFVDKWGIGFDVHTGNFPKGRIDFMHIMQDTFGILSTISRREAYELLYDSVFLCIYICFGFSLHLWVIASPYLNEHEDFIFPVRHYTVGYGRIN